MYNKGKTADEFNKRWNFPNCLGAIDGRHIPITCPPNSGSLFFNYKKFFSIVLLAICDANYRFMYINIGAYGSEGDSGVFAADRIGRMIYNDTLPLPEDTIINGMAIPFFFVADDAFPLSHRIMKPYVPAKGKNLNEDERIFNYRLSRARRCVENTFGICARKWLCLSQPLRHQPSRVAKIVATCCILHNLLIEDTTYCPNGFADHLNCNGDLIEGDWRRTNGSNAIVPLHKISGRIPDNAKQIRNVIKDFVNSPSGSVPWQLASAR